jgi:hypothetical protein
MSKTDSSESARINHLRTMSPFMAAMTNQVHELVMLAESDAMWEELDS